MKRRLIALIMVFTLAFSIAGCGSDNDKSEKKSKKKTEASDSKEKKNKKDDKAEEPAATEVAEEPQDTDYEEVLSESQIIELGDILTEDLFSFEFYMFYNYTKEQKFDNYTKGVLAAISVDDAEYIGDLRDDMYEIYEIPYDKFMSAVKAHFGDNVVIDIPYSRDESNYLFQVVHDSDDDYIVYSSYAETETSYEIISEEAKSFKENGKTYYEYTKLAYFDYWGYETRDPNMSITYVLSRDENSEYGVLIEDVYVKTFAGHAAPVSSEEADSIIERDAQFILEYYPDGCYATFVGAYKDLSDALDMAKDVESHMIAPIIILTSEWDNLNSEPYYAVCTEINGTKELAEEFLHVTTDFYPEAYIKFTGKRK